MKNNENVKERKVMNQKLQEKCQLFVANKEAIEKNFKWESSYVMPACGMLYTEKEVAVQSEKLLQCNDIVKKETSVFFKFQRLCKIGIYFENGIIETSKGIF